MKGHSRPFFFFPFFSPFSGSFERTAQHPDSECFLYETEASNAATGRGRNG
jgi:hypothetical protein